MWGLFYFFSILLLFAFCGYRLWIWYKRKEQQEEEDRRRSREEINRHIEMMRLKAERQESIRKKRLRAEQARKQTKQEEPKEPEREEPIPPEYDIETDNPFKEFIAPNPYNPDTIEGIAHPYKEMERLERETEQKFSTLPADFSNKRKLYRAMYREGSSTGELSKMENALTGLYSLALFYVFCYGSGSGNKGVLGGDAMRANAYLYKKPKTVDYLKQFTYKENGKITGCRFLSDLDWKHFVKLWGENEKSLDIRSLFQKFPGLPLFSDSSSLPSDTI